MTAGCYCNKQAACPNRKRMSSRRNSCKANAPVSAILQRNYASLLFNPSEAAHNNFFQHKKRGGSTRSLSANEKKTGNSVRYYCLKKIREAIVTNTILPIRFPQGIDTMTIPCGKSIRQ
ncbi:MAG: hypothetical protein LBD21_08425, partial [Tannerellaceae bacterium]|nr:hypothetical protein [Tannerellaceae bacterium]